MSVPREVRSLTVTFSGEKDCQLIQAFEAKAVEQYGSRAKAVKVLMAEYLKKCVEKK